MGLDLLTKKRGASQSRHLCPHWSPFCGERKGIPIKRRRRRTSHMVGDWPIFIRRGPCTHRHTQNPLHSSTHYYHGQIMTQWATEWTCQSPATRSTSYTLNKTPRGDPLHFSCCFFFNCGHLACLCFVFVFVFSCLCGKSEAFSRHFCTSPWRFSVFYVNFCKRFSSPCEGFASLCSCLIDFSRRNINTSKLSLWPMAPWPFGLEPRLSIH